MDDIIENGEETQDLSKTKSPSFIGGAMIIAGTAVGAGMFSIPTVSAGMWTIWAIVALVGTWFCMLHSGLMILETNLNYNIGASFNTMVKDTLGDTWNAINGFTVAFVGYILAYAYISGGGSIIEHTMLSTVGFAPPGMICGLLFAFGLAFFVWFSTKAVDRITTIFIGGMIVTFFMSVGDLTLTIKSSTLFDTMNPEQTNYFSYVFASLPFFLASFGFHHNVPSLMKYYGKNPKTIVKSLVTGTIIALVLYLFWLFATLGNIQRNDFLNIIAQGGNIGVLVEALTQVVKSTSTGSLLSIFANLAVASSFLGVTLGLFDYLADLLGFNNTSTGRLKTAAVTFIPPAIGGLLYPEGFLIAIGFAGLAATVWAAIVPALMVKASRKKFDDQIFRVWGGSGLVYLVVGYGILIAICHILSMFNMLPKFG